MELSVGDVIKNNSNLAGKKITNNAGKIIYIWKECKILKKTGFIQGTIIQTYKVIDDVSHIFTIDDNDIDRNRMTIIPHIWLAIKNAHKGKDREKEIENLSLFCFAKNYILIV